VVKHIPFLVAAALVSIVVPASARTILIDHGALTVGLDPGTNQALPIAPGTTGALLAAWLLTANDVETLLLSSFTVDLSIEGTAELWNMRLFDGTTELGTVQPSPGMETVFVPASFTIPQNGTVSLRLYGDVPFGNGTIQVSIPANGIGLLGASSFQGFDAPDVALEGGVHQVGTGVPTPEPWTLVPAGSGIIAMFLWRRRAKNAT
jgi:hypothetical protein